jgi:hypothetical protein
MNDFPVLLDDQAMQRFIREGYLVLQPDFEDGFHETVRDKMEKTIAGGKNPQNNVLPCVPELQQVFDHPIVHGALHSLLGPDYYLHLHRHVHDTYPGTKDQGLHKDSLYNSRFAVEDKRRHHRTRWLMVFYYPQDTPMELGPTVILPKSQYLNKERPEGEEELALSGPAGTVTIVHYDLIHRGKANLSDRTRYMVKFLFTRMTEPQTPSWDHRDSSWEPTGDPQDTIWRHLWDWHRGAKDAPEPSDGASIEELADRLGSESEIAGLTAAYHLGHRGEAALAALMAALKGESEPAARNAAYGFNRIGEASVSRLIDAAFDENPLVRSRALDVLGDMGLSAEEAAPKIMEALADAENDPRRRAAEALGTAGQRLDGLDSLLGERLAGDESGEVRRNAALSLARLGPKAAGAIPALEKGLYDANHYARGYSVHALKRIGTPEAHRTLIRHLETMRWDWEGH